MSISRWSKFISDFVRYDASQNLCADFVLPSDVTQWGKCLYVISFTNERTYYNRLKPTFGQNHLKPCQNKKDPKFVWAAPKMVSFSQLPAKTKQIFCPSYFVTTLTYTDLNFVRKWTWLKYSTRDLARDGLLLVSK